MSGRGATPRQKWTPTGKVLGNSTTVGSSSVSKVTSRVNSQSRLKSTPLSEVTPVQKAIPKIHGRTPSSSASSVTGSTSIKKSVQKAPHSQAPLVNITFDKPQFKKNLLTTSTEDPQLEIDLIYGEYLQTMLKKEIVTNIIDQHNQAMKDQLAIHHDLLHRRKQPHKLMEKEVTLMDSIEELNIVLNNLQQIVDEFKKLNVNCGLESLLEDAIKVLDSTCDGLQLKCVKGIQSQEEFAQVMKMISKCMVSAEKLEQSSENVENVSRFAHHVNELRDLMTAAQRQQDEKIALERSSAYAMLQSASDTFSL